MASNTPIEIGGRKFRPAEIAALMAEAEGWKPTVGDELEGHVLGSKLGNSDFREEKSGDGRYPIVFVLRANLDDPDDIEVVAFHAFQEIPYNEVNAQRPQRGDGFYAKFLGQKPGAEAVKGREPAQRYALLVTKPDATEIDIYDQLKPTRQTNGHDETSN